MQPESSGCNEVKYNLNVDTIEAIFKTYPAGEEIIMSLLIRIFLVNFVSIERRMVNGKETIAKFYEVISQIPFIMVCQTVHTNNNIYLLFSSVKRKHQEVVPHEV